jgi:hypothetical protein
MTDYRPTVGNSDRRTWLVNIGEGHKLYYEDIYIEEKPSLALIRGVVILPII